MSVSSISSQNYSLLGSLCDVVALLNVWIQGDNRPLVVFHFVPSMRTIHVLWFIFCYEFVALLFPLKSKPSNHINPAHPVCDSLFLIGMLNKIRNFTTILSITEPVVLSAGLGCLCI